MTGLLNGTVTDASGQTQQVTDKSVTLPLAASGSAQTCKILHLELGPLDLDLLGLKVHLNKVVLDITAQSGDGNLLGNLLCSVANLLNGQSPFWPFLFALLVPVFVISGFDVNGTAGEETGRAAQTVPRALLAFRVEPA